MAKGIFNRQIGVAVLLAAFILVSALVFADELHPSECGGADESHSNGCIASCNEVGPNCDDACKQHGYCGGACRAYDNWCCCVSH
ncbi:hypothetical protein AAC387_Pa06g2370 [Persea americana]